MLKDLKCNICFEITEELFWHESELEMWQCPKCGEVGNFRMMPARIATPRVKDGTPKFFKDKEGK